MNALGEAVLANAVLAGLLALVVGVTSRWLKRPEVAYWLWMLVFIKLILPPGLSSPASLGYWYHDWVAKGHPAPLTVVPVPVEQVTPQIESVGWALAHAAFAKNPASR